MNLLPEFIPKTKSYVNRASSVIKPDLVVTETPVTEVWSIQGSGNAVYTPAGTGKYHSVSLSMEAINEITLTTKGSIPVRKNKVFLIVAEAMSNINVSAADFSLGVEVVGLPKKSARFEQLGTRPSSTYLLFSTYGLTHESSNMKISLILPDPNLMVVVDGIRVYELSSDEVPELYNLPSKKVNATYPYHLSGITRDNTSSYAQYKTQMMDYLPLYYRDSLTTLEIMGTESREILNLRSAIRDVLDQAFIETATWGLDRRERVFGIEVSNTKSYEERRSFLKARLRGSGTVNSDTIKIVALSYQHGSVSVGMDYERGVILITFTDAFGIPINLDDIKTAIRDIAPAHLDIEYSFRYYFVREVEGITLTAINNLDINKFAF